MPAVKFKIKNPNAPATEEQKALILKLAQEKNEDFNEATLTTLTKGQASEYIGLLLQLPVQPVGPKPSLMEMAAALENGTPTTSGTVAPAPVAAKGEALLAEHGIDPAAAAGLRVLLVSEAEAKTLLSWYPVMAGEVDPTDADDELEQKLQAFLHPSADAIVAAAMPGVIAKATAAVAKANPTAPVPAGYYAIGEPGETKFYRVQYGKAGGNWEGFLFVDAQASDDFYPVKGHPAKNAVITAIQAQGVMESLTRYGHELGVCGVCHKTLTDPQSIADGIGPVCKAKVS